MSQLTFIDKVQVLFKLLFSSPIIIGIFAFSMVLMILLFLSSKFNKKIIKYIFILVYVGVIGYAIYKYGGYFLSSIDSFVTLFMANIYFPTIPVYVAIMLISFIIMIITLSGKKKSKLVKVINIVFFTLIQMLFALFIYIVEANKIDVSTNSNLYTNEQTLTLLELGMGLFLVWMILLLIIFYLKKADKIFKVKKNDDADDFDEYINDYNESNPANVVTLKKNINDTVVKTDNSVIASTNLENNSFNNSVIETLVPEVSFDDDAEVISFDDEIEHNNAPIDNGVSDVFNSFQFLDINDQVIRKDNDVEVLDFDD